MKFDRDIMFSRKRLRASAWLTLLSLALVQLSLASHQFDHAATELVDHCDVCVQLERLDDATSGNALPDAQLAQTRDFDDAQPADAAVAFRFDAFSSRAPPIS